MKSNVILAAAVMTAVSISSGYANPGSMATKQFDSKVVNIDDEQLDPAHGWEQLAPGVFQRIDQADGTISTASVGEAGRRYDLGVANAKLANARQNIKNALVRGQNASELKREIAELEAEIQSLNFPQFSPLAKGSATVFDASGSCHNVTAHFIASFTTSPRIGGGTKGTAKSDMLVQSCIAWECNPNLDAYPSSGYDGATYSSVRATNSGGALGASQYSNGGTLMPIYSYPSSTAFVSTPNVADSACSLRASGYVNSTFATTPYQSCALYKSFSVTKTCAQIP